MGPSVLANSMVVIILWYSEVKSLSRIQLFATPWTIVYQAPLSMGFSRQEYWSGLPMCQINIKIIKSALELTQCFIAILSQCFKKPDRPGFKCQVTSLGPLCLSVNFLDPQILHTVSISKIYYEE